MTWTLGRKLGAAFAAVSALFLIALAGCGLLTTVGVLATWYVLRRRTRVPMPR